MTEVTAEDIIHIMKEISVNVDLEELNTVDNLADQGVDSLDMTSILFEFEDRFSVVIDDESIEQAKWLTIDDMVLNLNEMLRK